MFSFTFSISLCFVANYLCRLHHVHYSASLMWEPALQLRGVIYREFPQLYPRNRPSIRWYRCSSSRCRATPPIDPGMDSEWRDFLVPHRWTITPIVVASFELSALREERI